MPVYEKVANGRVVETVHTVDGSHNDTLYGVLALEGRDGWRPLAEATPEPLPLEPSAPERKPTSSRLIKMKEGERDGEAAG